jgi:hypothetical protein
VLGSILVTLLAAPPLSALGGALPRVPTEPSPRIAVWTNGGNDPFTRGDKMTVRFRTDVDGYVTIMRVDTDGRLQVLFPFRPEDDNFARGGIDHRVAGRVAEQTLRVEEYPGEGFLFALVTLDPVAFPRRGPGGDWDYAALGIPARITEDPYAVFAGLLAVLLPDGYLGYAHDVVPYFVEEQHGYPRFMCYQCHAYVSPAVWDPYAHTCIRWRVADAGFPYPFAGLPGTDVIVTAPLPRYVVEPRQPAPAAPRVPRATEGRRPTGVTTPAPPGRAPAIAGPRRTTTPPAAPAVGGAPRKPPAAAPTRRAASPGRGRDAAKPSAASRPPARRAPAKHPAKF